MNRAVGDAVMLVDGSVWLTDHGDHVSSGSPTLPVRVSNDIEVPGGKSAFHVSEPNRLTSLVSRTSDTKVPAAVCPGESRTTDPGSPVPIKIVPSGSTRSERIWPLSSLAIGDV